MANQLPVGRFGVRGQPIKIVHFLPVVDHSVQGRLVEVLVQTRVVQVVRTKADVGGVLDNGPAGHVNVESGGLGLVDAKLLAPGADVATYAAVK